jgi:hypothetical protein
MTFRCYYKRERTPKRSPHVAACRRFVCAAVRAGVDKQEIRDAVEECIGDDEARRSRCDCQRLLDGLRFALEVGAAIVAGALLARFMPLILSTMARLAIFLPLSLRVMLPALRSAAPQLTAGIDAIEGQFVVLSRLVAREAARIAP